MLKRKTAVVGVTGNIWRRIVFGPGRSKDFKFMSNQQIFSIEAPHHGDHGVRDLFVAVKRQRGGRLKQSHVVGLLRVPAMRIKRSQWWWFWWRQWGRQWWHAYERLQKFDVDDILLEISVWSPEVLDSSRLQLQRALNLWSKWKQLVAIWSGLNPKVREDHHESSFITRPERCLVEALSKCGRASAQASALLEPEKGFWLVPFSAYSWPKTVLLQTTSSRRGIPRTSKSTRISAFSPSTWGGAVILS